MNDNDDEGNVVTGHFGGNPYRELEELHEALEEVLEKFDGRVSIAGVMGVFEIMKMELYNMAHEEITIQ